MNQHEMEQYLDFLGTEVVDKVTNLKGVIGSVSFDLYGCVQVLLTPAANEDGNLPGSVWFDINRVTKIRGKEPVMMRPSFSNILTLLPGPAEKGIPTN